MQHYLEQKETAIQRHEIIYSDLLRVHHSQGICAMSFVNKWVNARMTSHELPKNSHKQGEHPKTFSFSSIVNII